MVLPSDQDGQWDVAAQADAAGPSGDGAVAAMAAPATATGPVAAPAGEAEPLPGGRRGRRSLRRSRNRLGDVLFVTVDLVLILVVLVAALAIFGSVTGRWRTATVLSGSMRPSIDPGDVEVLVPEAPSAVRVGQVLAIRPPHAAYTVTHRVVAVQQRDGAWLITTKGDANPKPDPWGAVRITSAHAYKVAFVIPKIGWLTVRLHSTLWRIVVLFVVVGAACGWALRRVWTAP